MFGGEGGAGAEAVLVAADQAMYRAKEEGRNRIALFHATRASRGGEPRRGADDQRPDPRRAHPGPAQPRHAADPQPRLGRDRALRAAAADDRRERRAAAGRLLHRGRRALRHGPGARPLGRRAGAGDDGRARADGRPGLPPHQPLRRLDRPTSRCSNSSNAGSTKATPTPSRCTFEITQTARVEDYDTAGGFADRLTEFGCEVAIDDYGAGFGPFALPEEDPLRRDQDRRRLHPRHAPQRRRPADRARRSSRSPAASARRTIAEFVQDDDTAQMLREYGVDMAQGYHLGRPVDVGRELPQRPRSSARSSARLILPLLVFGSSAANSTMRGNL